ncbi:MAG: serine/threonine-protein kinase, partial [Actinomycetota bacterium]
QFAQEVAAARRVSGVFTAAVIAADPEADLPWLATAYVPAPSLTALVRACGPLPVPAVRWLAAGCAEALESIHNAGLVHRDLKPSNVLVSLDGPRVIDFGVARAAERIQLTVTRGAVGTPAYMAPEQARDTRQATMASDMFSLGGTLLFAATGHAPYQGETVMDVLVRLATEAPDLTGLPPDLASFVLACLSRDPRLRPGPEAVLASMAPFLSPDVHTAPLPGPALELVAEYRRDPRPSTQTAPDPGDDETFGSQPVLVPPMAGPPGSSAGGGRHSGRRSARPAGPSPAGGQAGPGAPAGAGAQAGPGQAGPGQAGPGPGSQPGAGGQTGSGQPLAGQPRAGGRPGAGGRRRLAGQASPGGRRLAIIAAAAVMAVAVLVVSGEIIGAAVAGHPHPQPTRTITRTVTLPPPPPPGAPLGGGGPAAVSAGRPGHPGAAVNQPTGDSLTEFVVYGRGWPPDCQLTVTLQGVGASPVHPVADSAGNFSYAINQQHEFFPHGLPLRDYQVVITGPGGAKAKARFVVNLAGGPPG